MPLLIDTEALSVGMTSEFSTGEQVLAILRCSIFVGFAAKDVTKFMGYSLLKQGPGYRAEQANQFSAPAS